MHEKCIVLFLFFRWVHRFFWGGAIIDLGEPPKLRGRLRLEYKILLLVATMVDDRGLKSHEMVTLVTKQTGVHGSPDGCFIPIVGV